MYLSIYLGVRSTGRDGRGGREEQHREHGDHRPGLQVCTHICKGRRNKSLIVVDICP